MFHFHHQLSSLFNLGTLPGDAPSHLPEFNNLYLTMGILMRKCQSFATTSFCILTSFGPHFKLVSIYQCKTLLHSQLPPPLLQSKYQESSENLQTLSPAPACMKYILFTIMIVSPRKKSII